MVNKVHTFSLTFDWELIRLISQIDRFDAYGLPQGMARCGEEILPAPATRQTPFLIFLR